MATKVTAELIEKPLYFAYRRNSTKEQFSETFHSHRGTEVLWIHQGQGTMIVNNVSYEIKPGMLCIFQPYQLHHLKIEFADDKSFQRSIATFEPTMFEGNFQQWPFLHTFFSYVNRGQLPAPCIYEVGHSLELETLFQSMEQKYDTLPEAEMLEEISLFLLFLFRCLRSLWPKQKDQIVPYRTRKQHHIEQVLEYIERHYMQPFQLDKMAKELHLSTYHISHLFKETIGISITEYMATRRTHQALLLLSTTNMPISMIAEQIGITNSSYFCKFFKSRTGTTPHQYRKRTK